MIFRIIKWCTIFGVLKITGVQPDEHGRIMKGTLAKIEKHPYMVAILLGGSQHCGGSIITTTWILTAAHCTGSKPIKYKVSVGSTSVVRGTVHDVIKVIPHPNYDAQNAYLSDIAMMQIKGKFKFGPTVRKINLATVERRSQDYSNCVTAGWGVTDADDMEHLQELQLYTIPLRDCVPFHPFRSNVCVLAFKNNAAPCFGDSGGPLVCGGIQVGLLSYGSSECDRQEPEVFTAVAAYYSWIRKVLKYDGLPTPR